MHTEVWRKEIARAEDDEALLETVRRFVRALNCLDLRELPEDCRPHDVDSPKDIAIWSFTLAIAALSREPAPQRDLLGEVALVFAEASTKIASLALGRPALTLAKQLAHEEGPA